MNAVFKKMNYKDQPVIHVLQSPVSFDKALSEMSELATVKKQLKPVDKASFVVAFCTKQKEVDAVAALVAKSLEEDGLLWMVYPKGTSKNYKCEFNRDNGWDSLGALGFEPVRMVAIDEDWSALRFRRVEFIKTMNRSKAITAEGKERIQKKK